MTDDLALPPAIRFYTSGEFTTPVVNAIHTYKAKVLYTKRERSLLLRGGHESVVTRTRIWILTQVHIISES